MRRKLATLLTVATLCLLTGCVSSVPIHGVKVPIKTAKKAVKTAAAVGAFIIPGGKKKDKKPEPPAPPANRPRYEPRRP